MEERFQKPVQNLFTAMWSEWDGSKNERGQEGPLARINLQLVGALVEIERTERQFGTPPAHLLRGLVSAQCNLLATGIRLAIEEGEQVDALKSILKVLEEQVQPRLGAPGLAGAIVRDFSNAIASTGGKK